jgi:hypothetical protein
MGRLILVKFSYIYAEQINKINLSFFSEVKNVIILYLLPVVLKPTGRPQLPISAAQDNFIKFETDPRRLHLQRGKTPHVVVFCSSMTGEAAFEDVSQVVLYVEGKYYICNRVLTAREHMRFVFLLAIWYKISARVQQLYAFPSKVFF